MPNSTHGSVAVLVSVIILIIVSGYFLQSKVNQFKSSIPTVARAEGAAKINTPSSTPTPTPDVSEQKQIDSYIRTIFGKDANVAIAVQRVECNPKNPNYPRCVYHTDHEYSVGIFQINLFNKTHWIHAQKVPGKTMDEKIENLKDPYINTLVAYKIFQDSGFNPWSGFTSGRYERFLNE